MCPPGGRPATTVDIVEGGHATARTKVIGFKVPRL